MSATPVPPEAARADPPTGEPLGAASFPNEVALAWQTIGSRIGLGVTIAGLVIIAGWILNISVLKSMLPGLVTVKFNSALAFCLAGWALWLSRSGPGYETRRRIATVCTLLVLVIAATTLAEYLTLRSFGIDELFVRDLTADLRGETPGRPSFATAWCFCLFGAALLLIDTEWRRLRPAEWFAVIGSFGGMVGFLGYLFGAPILYQFAIYSSMALPTALLLMCLGLGILLSRPQGPWMSVATSSLVGGRVLRRFLPLPIIAIVAVAYLRLRGEKNGYYGVEVGLAIFASFNIVCLGLVSWLAARYLNRLHAELQGQLQANAGYAALVASSDDAIVGKDLTGIVTSWNPAAERIFGWSAAEMIGASITRLIPPDRLAEERDILVRIGRGERVEHFETFRLHRSGRLIPVAVSVSPIRNAAGRVTGASKVARDITEQQAARRKQDEQDVLLRGMSAMAHVGGWSFDPATGEGTWTEEVARIYDMDPASATSRDVGLEAFHGEERAKLEAAIAAAAGGGAPYDLELEMITAAGNRKWVRTQGEAELSLGRVIRLRGSIQDITAQRRTETALRQSEEKFSRAFANNPAAMVLTDLDAGEVLEVNDTWLDLFGYSRAEVTGRSARAMWPTPADTARFLGEIRDAGVIRGREQAFRRKSGDDVVTEFSAQLIPLGGRMVILTTLTNITARKQAEDSLRLFRTYVDQSLDALEVIDLDTGRFIDVNQRELDMLGYTREEMLQLYIWDVDPRSNRENWRDFQELMRTTGHTHGETIHRRKDGAVFPIEYNVRRADTGRNCFVAAIRDISDRVRTEGALRAALRESGEFKTALDEHAIVAVTDPRGAITYVNDRFCAISKYAREELLGQDHRLINSGHHPAEFFRELWATIGRGRIWHGEICNRAKDGSIYWVDTTIVPFLDEHGKPRQYMAVRADITGIKVAQEDLARSNKDLEQFAYIASHDLQEPLRAVAGCLQVLQRRYQGKLDERADELIKHSVDGASRMQTLIEGLLAFSRVGAKGGASQAADAAEALAGALANLGTALRESGAVVTHDPLPRVSADQTQLTMVLQNLVGNAVKFRQPGQPHIHVGARREGASWIFSVQDDGIGIEPQFFDRIFVIFQRLHTRNEYPGTGIGLALCKKIVERHGGRIWVESTPGQGTTFYFSLSALP